MPNLIEQYGGSPNKQPKYVPIFLDRSFTGLFTQRSVLHDPSDVVTAKFYGGRPDALYSGKNIELTNRLTLQRRPGLVAFSTATYPTAPNICYSFQLTDGTIRVIVDTGSTGALAVTSVSASSAGDAVYTGVFPCGATNSFVGLTFQITGFANGPNNGTFLCIGSTSTTLLLVNANAIAETASASAISAGAVYWDQQNGQKTLLFAKSPGAGQTYFQAVAGILYMGDGVDTQKYTPLNPNFPPGSSVSVWNWGGLAPVNQPTVTSIASGSASAVWQANSFFTTMGLTVDAFGQAWQLIGVNADGSNVNNATFGTAGNGNPQWNQTLYGQTTETSGTPIIWQNLGQIQPWAASTKFGDAGVNGTAAPVAIFDLASSSIYLNFNNNGAVSTSGKVKPPFNGAAGSSFWDNQCHWFFLGKFSQMRPWIASNSYLHWYAGAGTRANLLSPASVVIEPFLLPPSAQPIYLQVPTNTGTSGSSYAPFQQSIGNANSGVQQPDGQLLWLGLGNSVWQPSTSYIQWQVQGTPFGVVSDGVNMQVCQVSGLSGLVKPGTPAPITSCANAVGGNTVYTGTFPTSPAFTVGRPVAITGFVTNPTNNGSFIIVSSTATTLTVSNPGGIAEAATAQAVYNPWGKNYGNTTQDGTVTWVCVGPQTTWVAGTATTGIWNLPLTGFQPPQSSQAFGGSTINSNTALVETSIVSGKSGTVQPTWNALHTNTGDPSSTLAVTSVSVSGTTTTYTGTITGGGANAFAGSTFLITGFANAGNNGIILVTASTATTLVCTTIAQISETNTAAAITGLVWFSESAVVANSLVWKTGLAYAYSFKARSFTDFFSPAPLGGGNIPPGSTFGALNAPTGSATNLVTTASPAFIITGGNTGAVNTITGLGSTDPQFDTIVIWRSADGGGTGQMFELTEIPAPKPINGQAQPWSFQDFLPDTATNLFPGLNTLLPAPINSVNNPPFSNYLPMAYNFQRIWGASGLAVAFSGGPDTRVGNPNEAFAPADSLPFLAPVVRIVKTPQGLVTFLTDSVEVIGGGPLTASFFSVTWAPGVGLLNFNALDILAGEMYFFSADNQFRIMTPSLNIANAGFALGDQFANQPSSGVSDANWDPNKIYVASHQSGVDNCIFVADGSTGWYRLNPHQVGAQQSTEPIWSPFAAITGGCKMVQSVEIVPGVKRLLVGATACNQQILKRDLTFFTDNGTPYDAFFVMGAITLAHSSQIALLKHMEFDFSGVSFQPTVSYLLNEISGVFTPFTAAPQFDPPSIYGKTVTPSSYSPNRYYFLGNASLARCRFLQIKIDFGTTPNPDEMFNACIVGRIMIET
jgi:hypothetical protein